jgi:hypothetical protein
MFTAPFTSAFIVVTALVAVAATGAFTTVTASLPATTSRHSA